MVSHFDITNSLDRQPPGCPAVPQGRVFESWIARLASQLNPVKQANRFNAVRVAGGVRASGPAHNKQALPHRSPLAAKESELAVTQEKNSALTY